MNKKACIYIRVSTNLQDNSVEVQEARIRDYIKYRGEFEICHVLIDSDVSGGIPIYERENGSKLKKLIENKEIECIIATKVDRLFRSTVDALTTVALWNEKNIALQLLDMGGQSVITNNAAGRMIFTVLVAFSEFERGRISERTTEVLNHKKKALKMYSPVPYGYKNESGALIPDETQQKAIELMKEMKAKDQSLRSIAKQLSLMNFKPSGGGQWHPSTIRQILDNELHA